MDLKDFKFRKFIVESLKEVLARNGYAINPQVACMSEVVDYILEAQDTEVYTAEQWFKDTRQNYPEYLVERKDIKSEVYDALSEIVMETGACQEDMEEAISWFNAQFYL